MSDRVQTVRLVVISLLVIIGFAVWWPAFVTTAAGSGYLTVRFLDVGQGDAIHITTPDGYELLIDGGPTAGVLRSLAHGRSVFDRYVDVVVATHPDTDHIGGLVDVLDRYEVGIVIDSGSVGESVAATAFVSAEESEMKMGTQVVTAQAGQVIQLGASTTVRILSPRGDAGRWETNTASVVVQVVYGDTEFLLTGDAPQGIEEYLVGAYGPGLRSSVLKLGHHGSDTSSSALFLEMVQPEYAVVSAGKDNRYGHPKGEVLERARKAGARIVSTIDRGTVTFYSDGKTVWIEK